MPVVLPGGYHSPYSRTIAELMARQGDIQARGAEASGQIWGGAVQNLGQIAGQAVQQHQEEKIKKQREMAVNSALQNWNGDPKALFRNLAGVIGPEKAMDVARGAEVLLKPEPIDWKGAAFVVRGARRTYESGGDAAVAQAWPLLSEKLRPLGAEAGVEVPKDYTPGFGKNFATWDDMLNKPVEQKAPERVEQNGQVFERQADGTWKQAIGLPTETPKATSLDQQLAAAYSAGDQAKVQSILALKSREAAATRAPKEVAAPEEMTFNPEGVVLSGYGVKQKGEARRQAMARGLPVFENPTTQAKGVVLAGIAADAKELSGLLEKDSVKGAIGPFAGRFSQLASKVVDLDPDVQRAIQLMTSLSDSELRKRSGAQINEAEMQRLMRFTTDPNRPLAHNTTAVNGLLKSSSRDYKALSSASLLPEPKDKAGMDALTSGALFIDPEGNIRRKP